MKSRRRFHGFSPPPSRCESNLTHVCRKVDDDDYTSNLSHAILMMAAKEVKFDVSQSNPMIQICLDDNVFDEDEEEEFMNLVSGSEQSFDSSDSEDDPPHGIHRKDIRESPSRIAEYVTSLSYDSKDTRIQRADSRSTSELEFKPLFDDYEVSDSEGSDSGPPTITTISVSSATDGSLSLSDLSETGKTDNAQSFAMFRCNYLLVTTAIMLADGLQGTHLYVLYEGYGYSVASLYCLGFVTGAVTTPITGPLVDKIGRKKAALIYCALEIGINMLEQYPFLAGLIVSRMVGGITTNLLSSVFETWLDTEFRRRAFDEKKYEIVMRDSVIVSNLAAIASGYLAHQLAERLGPVGPFEGAVACTAVAFAVVASVWTENYGSPDPTENQKSIRSYLSDAIETFRSDSKVLRIGIIQGLTTGSIQIFIFLWSPALREFARNAPPQVIGLDSQGEPAYGLIFGAFMASGVLGGLMAPAARRGVTMLLSPLSKTKPETLEIEGEGEVRPMAVEFLAASCYLVCAGLLLLPCLVAADGRLSFSLTLGAFLIYEFIIGIHMPCEGVIRSIYIPSDARCSLLTVPRMIVNIAVSLGVVSTNYLSVNTAFATVSCLMVISSVLQISLISSREWESIFGRVERLKRRVSRSLSFTFPNDKRPKSFCRSQSMPVEHLGSITEEGKKCR